MTTLVEDAIDAHLYFARFPLVEGSGEIEKLAAKAVAGDTTALGDLITKLDKNLKVTARARGLPREDVEDVVQDALTKLLEPGRLAKFKKDPAGIVPWLHRTVINKALNLRKRASRRGSAVASVAVPGEASVFAGFRHRQMSSTKREVVRGAVERALAGHFTGPEKAFVLSLFGGGDFKMPEKGEAESAAKAAGRAGTKRALEAWASRVKKKFLKALCTDRRLCDLLPSHKGVTGRVRKSVKYACRGVAGSCVESEIVQFASALTEDDGKLDEGAACELVLSWLQEVLAEG